MNRRAFSLVELSIVLVILGLLTGGILAGQSLIRAAELRSVANEYSRYVTAMGSFRDKYFALPGDMTNAQSFWTAAATCPGTSATPSTSIATCNGDGNGRIRPDAATANEVFRFWQHLANAGLIEGTYTGVSNSATASSPIAVPGQNIPASKLNTAGWTPYTFSTSIGVNDVSYFEGDYGTFFFMGALATTNVSFSPIVTPAEAWNIDTKMDDGKPATGRVLSLERDGGTGMVTCSDLAPSNSASLAGSNYALANTGTYCAFMMKTGF